MVSIETYLNDNYAFVNTFIQKIIKISSEYHNVTLQFRHIYKRHLDANYHMNYIDCFSPIQYLDWFCFDYAPINKLRFVNNTYESINELFTIHSDLYSVLYNDRGLKYVRYKLLNNNDQQRYYYKIIIDKPIYKFLSFHTMTIYINNINNLDSNGILIDFYDIKSFIKQVTEQLSNILFCNNDKIKTYSDLLDLCDKIIVDHLKLIKHNISNISYSLNIQGPVI